MLKINEAHQRIIVLTGGGTAGHVMPNIALLPFLEREFSKIHYIGSYNGIERDIIAGYPQITYHAIETAKLRRSFSISNFATPFKVLAGIRQAKRIISEIKPDIIFSKGGFVAYPVVSAGAKLKNKVIIHESDLSMGLANRMCVKHANVILTTFSDTEKVLRTKYPKKEIIHTGAPLRSNIYHGKSENCEKSFSERQRKNLLVIGGSLGAKRINDAVENSAEKLIENGWNILHICGKGKRSEVKINGYVQFEYMDNIHDALAWAHVVVSRAGSNSISELMVTGKPALFIPLSTGRGDQIENAKFVEKFCAGAVLPEEELNQFTLEKNINNVWERREELNKKALELGKTLDGTENVARILKLLQK